MKEKFKVLMPYLLVGLLFVSMHQRVLVLRVRAETKQTVHSNLTEFTRDMGKAPYDESTYLGLYENLSNSQQVLLLTSKTNVRSILDRGSPLIGLVSTMKYLLASNRETIPETFTPGSEELTLLAGIIEDLEDDDSIIELITLLEAKY